MLQLMGEMFIEFSETRVGSSSYNIPIDGHVAISWTLDSVL